MSFESWLDSIPIGMFRKPFVLESPLRVSEVSEALAAVTRRPFAFGKRKGFVGRVGTDTGRIQFDRGRSRPVARTMRFKLTPVDAGCRLDGELIVTTPLRLFVLTYLLFCMLMAAWMMFESVRHGGSLWLQVRYLLQASACAAAMIYGYTGLVILFTGRNERLGLKIMRYILAGPPSSDVALDLLNSR